MKFIDTNVLVYFADGRNREKQSIERAILADAMGSRQHVISFGSTPDLVDTPKGIRCRKF